MLADQSAVVFIAAGEIVRVLEAAEAIAAREIGHGRGHPGGNAHRDRSWTAPTSTCCGDCSS